MSERSILTDKFCFAKQLHEDNYIGDIDWILYNNKRKKCFGVHHNGNILIKMNGTLVQVNKSKCKTYA